MGTLHLIAGIAWDPQIRGFLAVAVGVVVLLGTPLLLLATNVGSRLGFLVAAAAFWGWMLMMGIVWAIYGTVGMLGELPHWEITEVVYPSVEVAGLDVARDLETGELPPSEELNELEGEDLIEAREQYEPGLAGWKLLPESNPSFGEAKATVDEYMIEHPIAELEVAGPDDYTPVYSFERGGKDNLPNDPTRWDRITKKVEDILQVRHPAHYAIVQVQPVLEQAVVAGEPPPLPRPDPSAPVISVIMQRDLGDRRFPGIMLTIASGIMFGVLCQALHRRDQRVAMARGLVPTTAKA
ncbi:MAG: hypothetical protein Q8K58_13655 [Acidimicrobiales bacterium]|nr:hypothetical protein [Acidimicrobiales bacterium]